MDIVGSLAFLFLCLCLLFLGAGAYCELVAVKKDIIIRVILLDLFDSLDNVTQGDAPIAWFYLVENLLRHRPTAH